MFINSCLTQKMFTYFILFYLFILWWLLFYLFVCLYLFTFLHSGPQNVSDMVLNNNYRKDPYRYESKM